MSQLLAKQSPTGRTPAGGAANIQGVYFQMLWCLLRAGQIVLPRMVDDSAGQRPMQLVLEPIGGGGDVREIEGQLRRVVQLKVRSGGGTWSLRELIEEVFSDLFKAVDLKSPETEYCFVTDGRAGRWGDVPRKLFEALHDRPVPDDPLSQLDDTQPIAFGRHKASDFWKDATYTQRSLFEFIARRLLASWGPAQSRPDQSPVALDVEHLRRVWLLLRQFRFIPRMDEAAMVSEIDAVILEHIDLRDQVVLTRNAMIASLAERARHGGATIVAKDFFAEHQLASIALSRSAQLRDRTREMLQRRIGEFGYEAEIDVRTERAIAALGQWEPSCPILAFTGASGLGKTWVLYAAGDHLARCGNLVVLVEATGDAERDLDAVATAFWQDIARHDQPLALSRVSTRFRELNRNTASPWLTVLIDGVQVEEEARCLARVSWKGMGIRLAVSCSSEIASVMENATPAGIRRVVIDDFTIEEVQDYLERTMGDGWPEIPADVRNILRRPILAAIYRSLGRESGWQPRNEFALFQAYWLAIGAGSAAGGSVARHKLSQLAAGLLNDVPYPWTMTQLDVAELDRTILTELIARGWLRPSGQTRFDVPHDRLLNWAVAEGLLEQFRSGQIAAKDLISRIWDLLRGPKEHSGRSLGYVPLDVVYLLQAEGPQGRAVMKELLATVSREDSRLEAALYGLLPTVGDEVASVLFERIAELADARDRRRIDLPLGAASRLSDAQVSAEALKLLESNSPGRQRAALRLLKLHPTAAALDRLWDLHCSIDKDPAPYLDGNEAEVFLQMESFGALRECVRLEPDWLERTIAAADPTTMPVHELGYLVANMRDKGHLWQRCKRLLMQKIPESKARAIALNIAAYLDADEREWLIARVDREDDLVGPAALLALTRLDAKSAAQYIERLPAMEIASTRHWWLGAMLASAPDDTRAVLLKWMKASLNPWWIAETYRDFENDMDTATIDFLLDRLEFDLDQNVEADSRSRRNLFHPLVLLSAVRRAELIRRFEARRHTPLAQKLVALLIRIGPPVGYYRECPERDDALRVLQKIGGDGIAMVLNAYLKQGCMPGRLDYIRLCPGHADEETQQELIRISLQEERVERQPVEQGYATKALAALGLGRAVVDSILRWGPETLLAVDETYARERPLSDPDIQPALEVLNGSDADRLPGAVMVIGFSRRMDRAEAVVAAFAKADPASELAFACVLALGDLRHNSPDVVALLSKQLGVPEHQHAACQALLAIASDESLLALCQHLEQEFDLGMATALLEHSSVQDQAVQLLRRQLTDMSSTTARQSVAYLLSFVARRSVCDLLKSTTGLEEHLRDVAFAAEGSIWFTGSKALAIRGLALFDSRAATRAVRAALQNIAAHDREAYPYLMMELDSDGSIPHLLAQVLHEKSSSVWHAIGRALSSRDLTSKLIDWARAGDDDERLAACRVARWQPTSADLKNAITECAERGDRRTSGAALETLQHWREAQAADELLVAFGAESDRSRRWVLLDALIDTADPGDMHGPSPSWVHKVLSSLEPYWKSHLRDRLKDRRSKEKKELERKDRA